MNNVLTVDTIQRALYLAWFEAEKAVSHLIATKPEEPEVPEDMLGMGNDPFLDPIFAGKYREWQGKTSDWRTDFNEAVGERCGLHKACVIAGVFKE